MPEAVARIPRRQAYTLTELNSFGTLAEEAVGLLTELVEKRVDRKSVV